MLEKLGEKVRKSLRCSSKGVDFFISLYIEDSPSKPRLKPKFFEDE